jgi:hypothetical protein
MNWHAPQHTIDAYVAGHIADADAWSVEAHLASCQQCRAAVADAVHSPASPNPSQAESLASTWAAVSSELPEQGRIRRGTTRRGFLVLLASGPAARWAWVLATLVVLALAVGMDQVAHEPAVIGLTLPVLALVAPILPVLGVAASYGAGLDDAYEVIASTPAGGLRLLLVRTVAVLAVTIPATLVAALAGDLGWSMIWLLPCLALTMLTLALGSVTGIARAAAVVSAAWVAVVAVQAVGGGVVHILAAAAMPGWLGALAVAMLVVVIRRETFNHLPFSARVRSEA